MPTSLVLIAHLALHALFLWGMQSVFRKQRPAPPGVWLIVLGSAASIGVGAWLIARRDEAQPALDALALLLAAGAAALFVAAVRTVGRQRLRAAFSQAGPHTLVIHGPYRWLRHPFYAAYLLGHAMPWVASRSALALPGLLLMALVYLAAARDEEYRFLGGPLAPAWRRYAARTGRFLPRWRGLFPMDSAPTERTLP